MTPNLENYVLNVQDRDWAELLAKWSWLLDRPFVVRLANRFGDLFVAWEDGSLHFLDVGSGALRPLAADGTRGLSHVAKKGEAHRGAFFTIRRQQPPGEQR